MLPPDDKHPRDIWHALDDFLDELSGHLTKRRLGKVLFETSDLSGSDVGSKPEAFTEDELIFPLLTSVDLQKRREPGHQEDDDHDRWPDFQLTNTAIAAIGENKPINHYDEGIADIEDYLRRDSFDTPYGVATDGIDWAVVRLEVSGGRPECKRIKSVSLRKTLQHIADRKHYADLPGFANKPKEHVLDPIAEFIETFRLPEFDEWTLMGLPLEQRRRYLSNRVDSQPSLAWFDDPKRRG